ncbi:MAG: lipoprotein [Sphingomonadales bacterium]|nr:lipoprotein [Sphingomonadales bacterium]
MRGVLILALVAMLAACGKKGELRPPAGHEDTTELPGYGESERVQEREIEDDPAPAEQPPEPPED